ncbi:MAG TPA: TetR/AcrR family transcriptional regulator [Deltaproteobacteria bacterium]|nr:TetR/AcrR family transcriptional regulator [Deltaproteobacteria bacterium]HIJ76643.1 TetR/AcrR family transcriptional regulator [Deltaproteobacteria bacterium]
MQKYPDQQNVYANVKKMALAGNRQGLIEAISEETSASTPESLTEELSHWFFHIRGPLRTGPLQNKIGLSVLMEALGEIARKKGIPASRFYPSLLEKILTEEAAPLLSKPNAKERILEAALEVFSHKGFHPATMDEISDKAGVGKGTLYRYFETKEKLFAELVRLRLEELGATAGSVIDGRDDVLTMISKCIRMYFEFFDRNQRLYRLIIQEQLDLGEHSPDEYFRKVMRAIPNLKRKVYEGTQQGILKDVDFQTVFYGTMGFAHGVIQKWLARECSYPLVNELPGVLEVLFYGFVKDARRIECEN